MAVLPHAYRVPLAIPTCRERLTSVTGWLNWLTGQGITSLAQVTQQHCDAYLDHRRHTRDVGGQPVRERGPASRRETVAAVLDLRAYSELFAVGGYPPGLRPWNRKPASTIAGVIRRDQNATPPVADRVLRPMLAAALHITEVIGPFAADLAQQARAGPCRHRQAADPAAPTRWPRPDHRPGGPFGLQPDVAAALRPALEDTLARVGTAAPWGRDAARIPAAGAIDPSRGRCPCMPSRSPT